MISVENLRKGDIFIWAEMDWIYIVLANKSDEEEFSAAAYWIEESHWFPYIPIPYLEYADKIDNVFHIGNIEIVGISHEEIDQFVEQIIQERRNAVKSGSR